MARYAVLLCLVISASCAPSPQCITSCGLEITGTFDCEGVQGRENAAINTLGPVLDLNPGEVCGLFSGWRVDVLNGKLDQSVREAAPPVATNGSFIDPSGRTVAGLTYCDQRKVEVAWNEAGWRSTATVHELVHVMDGCSTPNHWGWTEHGIFEAIDAANGAP